MTKDFSVAVVGGGAVGTAVADYYDDVKVYDKYKDSDSLEQACSADYIFVAVPTPFSGGQDLTEMDDAVKNIAERLERPGEQIVILKSTVVPGTTDKYQKQYPDVNFVFNPEFLTESVAVQDFREPDKQLVGYTEKTKDLADQVLGMLPPAPVQKAMPAKEAEMVKYTINSYYAFKVIFGNQIYDICQKAGADYDQVHEGLVADKRIVDSHFDVFHGGSRGYGGKCLPKDVATLSWLAQQNGLELKLIDTVIKLNQELLNNE